MNSKKIVPLIILVLIVVFLLIVQNKKDESLMDNGRYTVGKVVKKNIVARASPTYVYEYMINNKIFRQKGSSGFNGKVNNYYFVIFNPDNPEKSEILINFVVPDNISEVPKNGWKELPVPHTKKEIFKGIR